MGVEDSGGLVGLVEAAGVVCHDMNHHNGKVEKNLLLVPIIA